MKLSGTAAFFIPVLLIPLQALSSHNSQESLEARVAAVGSLNVGGADDAAPAAEDEDPVDGESVYNTTCAACHGAGIAGAPAVGAADDWVDRIAQGLEILVERAIQGYTGSAGVMPAKGGNPALSDEAVTAAVRFMVDQSQ